MGVETEIETKIRTLQCEMENLKERVKFLETLNPLCNYDDFFQLKCKPLTDDERLAEIQCLMTELGMTNISEEQQKIIQKIWDLTNRKESANEND